MKWLLSKYNAFNNFIAIKLGGILSSMTFFWICVVIDLVELPPVIEAHSIIVWCTYIAQTVIQLVALPVLGVLQKTGNDHHENHSDKLDAIKDSLDELHKKHVLSDKELIATYLEKNCANFFSDERRVMQPNDLNALIDAIRDEAYKRI